MMILQFPYRLYCDGELCFKTGLRQLFRCNACDTFFFVCWLCLEWLRCVLLGSAKCHECGGNNRQAGLAFTAKPQLVHPSDVCHQWWWLVWGTWLVVQPAEECQSLSLATMNMKQPTAPMQQPWEENFGLQTHNHNGNVHFRVDSSSKINISPSFPSHSVNGDLIENSS